MYKIRDKRLIDSATVNTTGVNSSRFFKYMFTLALCLMLFLSVKVLAEASSTEYKIENYDIDMIVNEDNTFFITEKITVYFHKPRHGIYREIPITNKINRTDGTKSTNRAKITNIDVNENYKISNQNGYKIIKIGDAKEMITGRHTYIIKYNYDIGRDPLKNADELYFKLIGSKWDTSISNIIFKITMPKSFDKSLLSFSVGDTDSIAHSNVRYQVKGNIITGSLDETLDIGETLTVKLKLPEGYFESAPMDIDLYSICVIIFSIVCVMIAYFLWNKYEKNNRVFETVKFYSPEGYNPAEISFLYNGFIDEKGISSLLWYLADKGYLKIEEIEERIKFSKQKGFRITKIKEYDGNNEYEKIFFEGLFCEQRAEMENRKEEEKHSCNSVTSMELYNSFYKTIQLIKETFQNNNKISDNLFQGKRKWIFMMIIAIYVLVTTKPTLEYRELLGLLVIFYGGGVGLFCFIKIKIQISVKAVIRIIFLGMFSIIPWTLLMYPVIAGNTGYWIMYVTGVICIETIILFEKMISRRTAYENEILGEIRGFRKFLKTAKKSQLEALTVENSEYFYNILPYACALGLSDVWVKKFRKIELQTPRWYDSYIPFKIKNFSQFMNHTMKSVQTVMMSSPSNVRGSTHSGGASGGGSGGGGGGAW